MPSWYQKVKTLVLGKAKDPSEADIFQKLSLVAFLAWIGLGSDGLSSSCYGPEEAFLALGAHTHLAILIALASAVTIFVIGSSYSQIVEEFPAGGGGYVVATKLLSPTLGMVSGCALLIDYVLTIAISIASGSDALFSFLPHAWLPFKIYFAAAGVVFLVAVNLRGVRESILVLLPVFLVFLLTHIIGILATLGTHALNIGPVMRDTAADFSTSVGQIGMFGIFVLLLRSYSMGAGTYTGIEAVSNGVSILREPRVRTAKRTMLYMMCSLAFVVIGIMFSYLLVNAHPEPGKTLNAVLFGRIFGTSGFGYAVYLLTLLSEAAILFVAAQTGFLGGPRVIANMAMDRWFPTQFTMLSDRLVTQNGVLLMGGAAVIVLLATGGSVGFLVVLYSINVFITFVLSQLGMVRHWWKERTVNPKWKQKIAVNGLGLVLTSFILVSVIFIKFNEGGWVTLLVTGLLIAAVLGIKRHYNSTTKLLKRLDTLVSSIMPYPSAETPVPLTFNPKEKTAVILVSGFNGLGLHTLFGIARMFRGIFRNFVVVEVGIVDSGAFKGAGEVERLQEKVQTDINRFVNYIRRQGYYAEGVPLIGTDVVDEVSQVATDIRKRFPDCVFFGGQLVFPEEWFFSRWLHNYTVFAIQRKFYYQGIPVVLLPIRI